MAPRLTTSRNVIEYMKSHPDEPVTIDELINATGASNGAISGAISRLLPLHPQLSRKQQGVYTWNPKARVRGVTNIDGGLIVVKVLEQREDGSMLISNEEGALWKCLPLKW